jgi:ABC-type transport system involved in cytochrome bd biosynthesis fused ATPase/permease subunit
MDSFVINKENFDLELLLKYLRDRSAEQGIESANAGVAFRDVTCWGIDASAANGPSVTEMSLQYLQFWKMFKKDNRPQRKIIQNFIGVLEPGEMVLCLGKPGAGCSSLLKSVAGEIGNFTKVEGNFSYDGLDQEEMMKKYKGYVVYNPELDFHFPYITVKETIQLALRCKTPEKRIDNMSREEYVDNMLKVCTNYFHNFFFTFS